MYRIKLPQFEGPLDLLLHLIEREKLDITQVSLSQVTDQYIACIREKEAMHLGHLGSFLTVAAQLLLIKSRALLPALEATEMEEEALDNLEERLRLYQRYRDAARRLGGLFSESAPCYSRESYADVLPVFYPPEGLSAAHLRQCFENVLGELSVAEELEETALENMISLDEKILSFQNKLRQRVETTFRELVAEAATRVELIVSFLVLLELIKQSFLTAEQDTEFADIRLKMTARV